jgi:hypothetical protein
MPDKRFAPWECRPRVRTWAGPDVCPSVELISVCCVGPSGVSSPFSASCAELIDITEPSGGAAVPPLPDVKVTAPIGH